MTTLNPDDLLHYFKKADILRSTVEGVESTALCGACFVAFGITRGGLPGLSEVCPVCLAAYTALPSGRAAAERDMQASA